MDENAPYETDKLLDYVLPISYGLDIKTDIKNFVYYGDEDISLDIRKQTNYILIHSLDLKISDVKINSGKTDIECKFNYTDKKFGLLKISFNKKVIGKVHLKIKFEGKNNDNLYGFYRSSYNYKNKKVFMLTTHFEPNRARAAFPCFDAPIFKSTFNISLNIEDGYDGISNTPILSSKRVGKRKIIKFEKTPLMSTYLVYMGVGKYEYNESNLNGLKIRIVTPLGKIKYSKLALEIAKNSIKFYQDYFKIDYPLKKVDLIAVPDFAAGAMENWGALTFRELGLLYDENNTDESIKLYIYDTIAHELAHQWFGDLVTMKWWDDLWLNESFATFMSHKAINSIYPKLNIFDEFYLELLGAFTVDSLKNTHPISSVIKSSDYADSVFDAISYQKGGGILNMINDFMGEDSFREGLSYYLKKYKYKNASKDDFWSSLQKMDKGKNDIKGIMRTWIDNSGYPILSMHDDKSSYLEQKRFMLNGGESKSLWNIPIIYYKGKNKDKVVMDEKRYPIKDLEFKSSILDPDNAGFYILNVNKDSLKNQISTMIKRKMNLNYIGIPVHKYFMLLRAGYITINDYIDVIDFVNKYLKYPSSYIVSSDLYYLYKVIDNKKENDKIKKLISSINNRLISEMGLKERKNDSSEMINERKHAILFLALIEDTKIKSYLGKVLNDYLKGNSIDANLRDNAFLSYMIEGDKKRIDTLLKAFEKATTPSDEKRGILISLSLCKKDYVKYVLDYSLSDKVRPQDSAYVLGGFSYKNKNIEEYLKWLKANWKKLNARYDPTSLMLKDYISCLRSIKYDKTKEELVNLVGKDKVRKDIARPYKITLELIDNNIKINKAN